MSGSLWKSKVLPKYNINYFLFLFCEDYKQGFGGQFGVQTDRVDKSAHSWQHHEKLEKHVSQKGIQTHDFNPFF